MPAGSAPDRSTAPVTYETRDGVSIISLNRPAVLNALNTELAAALADTVDRAADEPDTYAVVVRGAGRAFCSGMDRTALAAGHTFTGALASSAQDADGNSVTLTWRFRTAGGAPRPAGPVATASPGGGSAQQYALNQVNAARASYGFAPLVLDATISAVAYGHAADMAAYNYFSHTSRNGMTFAQRLTAGGVSYGYRGENICFLGGATVTAALNWCHAQFMAEPYPGGGNHKDNILNPNFRRIGIGIAIGGGRVYVVWDFTD